MNTIGKKLFVVIFSLFIIVSISGVIAILITTNLITSNVYNNTIKELKLVTESYLSKKYDVGLTNAVAFALNDNIQLSLIY